ncbi:MAG: hypothetical protein V1870_01175 [Candidatus Aenigmatarchaeota archaeon]
MYLDNVFGSKTKINILAELLQNPEKEFMESELSKNIDSSLSEVNRQIRDLVLCGLVSMKKTGRIKIYSINKKHFLFSPLKKLFQDLNTVFRQMAHEISNYLSKTHKIETVIIFGSLAKDKIRSDIVREPSDVDILIITKDNIKKIKIDAESFINNAIFPKYGIVAYPIVLSKDEYLKRLDKDQFIINVHANGEVIYGKLPRRSD